MSKNYKVINYWKDYDDENYYMLLLNYNVINVYVGENKNGIGFSDELYGYCFISCTGEVTLGISFDDMLSLL